MDDERINPGHRGPRNFFRKLGPIILAGGVLCMIVAFIDFFGSMGGFGGPDKFWLFFVGMPLIFVGGVMTKVGYMGKIARYMAQEMAPVGKDTFNYMADGTKDSIKTVAQAFSEGIHAGRDPAAPTAAAPQPAQVSCPDCGNRADADAKFCDECGVPLTAEKSCPLCQEPNDLDAKFCDNCGHKFM